MNLIFLLLGSQQFLTREQIREAIADYRDSSDTAFERKFERDKEELRELGVTIEVGSHEAFGVADGYRIVRDEVEVPDVEVTAAEATMIATAAGLWEGSTLALRAANALGKLRGIGVDFHAPGIDLSHLRLAPPEPSFETFLESVTARRRVSFDYRDSHGASSQRQLEPWHLFRWRNRWYVGGWDIVREAKRVFRLSRVTSDVTIVSEPGSFERGNGEELEDLAKVMFPRPGDELARVLVRAGRGHDLRRYAVATSADAVEGFDRLEIPLHSISELAATIVGYGPDVIAEAPEQLVEAVRHRLLALVETYS